MCGEPQREERAPSSLTRPHDRRNTLKGFTKTFHPMWASWAQSDRLKKVMRELLENMDSCLKTFASRNLTKAVGQILGQLIRSVPPICLKIGLLNFFNYYTDIINKNVYIISTPLTKTSTIQIATKTSPCQRLGEY